MYVLQKYGLYSDSFMISSSSSTINKMLYGGALFAPIKVPRFFNTTSAKSIMVSVETYFSVRVFFLMQRASSHGKSGE